MIKQSLDQPMGYRRVVVGTREIHRSPRYLARRHKQEDTADGYPCEPSVVVTVLGLVIAGILNGYMDAVDKTNALSN